MSNILVDTSGKGGPCCSFSIDLERGCKNKCIGCYGTKTSLMGADKYYNQIVSKDFNENKFRASAKNTVRKGNTFARLGKHSDAANIYDYEILKSVLKIAGEEGLRLIFVSKSLTFNKEIATLLKDGNHVLHMSLGMITEAQSEFDRYMTYRHYTKNHVCSYLRIVADITKNIPIELNVVGCEEAITIEKDRCIITPMRFSSKDIAGIYKADLNKYEFVHGYYKPKEVHESWNVFKHWCGEINGEIKCCKCLGE